VFFWASAAHYLEAVSEAQKNSPIVFIQTIENEGGELIITERLSNRGKSVCQSFRFIEEGRNGKITLFLVHSAEPE
jgi:hypothetical protein